jgi:hypothetical protein
MTTITEGAEEVEEEEAGTNRTETITISRRELAFQIRCSLQKRRCSSDQSSTLKYRNSEKRLKPH